MESSGRRKLFEILNRTKNQLEQANLEPAAVPSSSHNPQNNTQDIPRGAGRGRLFRQETSGNENHARPTTSSTGAIPKSSRVDTSINNNGSDTNEQSKRIDAAEMKVAKAGSKGDAVSLAVNYIPIHCRPGSSIFDYDVKFEPNIHSNKIRRSLVAGILKPIVTVFTFDGTSLYLPRQLSENVTKFTAINRYDDNSPVQVIITFRCEKSMAECIHFYNVLFKQVMLRLEYVQFGRKMFDPTEPKNIPHRQLTIWPGYVLSCNEYDNGLFLMMDTSHRVLFDTRVSDLLRRIRMSCKQNSGQNFKNLALQSLLGAVVLTPYNNKTYRIDDVDFDKNPRDTFRTAHGEISYREYYKTNYGLDIHDLDQPLLISYKDKEVLTKEGNVQKERISISLIPELSQLTGITDEMRLDNNLMRDIASYTRVTPNQRVEAIRKYIERVNDTPAAKGILDNWGLRLHDDILRLNGRTLPLEIIKFGNGKIIENVSGDFSNQIGNSVLFEVVDLNHWILMYTHQDSRIKDQFMQHVNKCASGMGLVWKEPTEYMLSNDRTETYAKALREILQPNTQIVVLICPTSRDDRYSTIKKICCSEKPIASQVINSRTLSNQQKNRSIVQKILMQMNCKLGGSLWTIRIPFKKKIMICGTDTYHSPSKKENSVAAFVASMNNTYTKWYSKATIQSNHEELLHGLTASMMSALKAYQKLNDALPEWIILYRDGVGDGQFKFCKEFEVNQIKSACRLFDPQYNPNITFIIVQKRVNTRIFAVDDLRNGFENPLPGTVLDHSITRPGLFDFYLISQKMRHGTITPSHYVVIENETNLSADILQQLSYKLTYQYFNWPGSIRVPAPCQYAHKLAYLVGESVKRETSEKLNDKLFYL